jgi:hypothetical protein
MKTLYYVVLITTWLGVAFFFGLWMWIGATTP